MKNFNAGWYLIYTKPRHEKKVHTRLNEMNIDSFLPLTKKLHTWHDRKKYVDEPLFPSYVFIYLNNMESYYGGMDADGALYYVRTGKEIAKINETVINNIKLVADQAKNLEVSAVHYQAGQQLTISQGVLAGLACELVQINGSQKALVRVTLLQRSILLTLPKDCLISC